VTDHDEYLVETITGEEFCRCGGKWRSDWTPTGRYPQATPPKVAR